MRCGQLVARWWPHPPAAAVPGGVALQRPADGEHAGVQVDVVPGQAQRLALAQPERQRDRPPGAVRLLVRDLDEPGRLLSGERLHLAFDQPRRPGPDHRVAQHLVATDGLVQGGPQDAVQAVHRARRQPVAFHPGVERLDVLGLQPVQPMGSESGDRVALDVGAVAVQGAPAHRAGGDVLQPVVSHSPTVGARPAAAARPLSRKPLELADLAGDLGSGGAHDVAPVRLAVVVQTHGDPPVPVAVTTLVGAGRLVRGPSGSPVPLHLGVTPPLPRPRRVLVARLSQTGDERVESIDRDPAQPPDQDGLDRIVVDQLEHPGAPDAQRPGCLLDREQHPRGVGGRALRRGLSRRGHVALQQTWTGSSCRSSTYLCAGGPANLEGARELSRTTGRPPLADSSRWARHALAQPL